tara:strand:+ start:888 stop:1301 length:414 start_codon:yes stop_codon:yes gene_type:complete
MDEVTRQLLERLRSRPYHELDENERDALEALSKEENDYLSQPATPEDAIKTGDRASQQAAASRLPGCPKCGSNLIDRQRTYAKLVSTCTQCGRRWDGGLPVAPAATLPTKGPFSKPSGASAEPPLARNYFRNPKKVM